MADAHFGLVRDGSSDDALDDFQCYLPTGLRLTTELHGTGIFGRVFKALDTRIDNSNPARRVVRFLRAAADDTWKRPLWERLRQLQDLQVPYVSLPREAEIAADGTVFIVSDHLGQPLSDKIRTDVGVHSLMVAEVVDQLLTGLAELHRAGISHGDLRPGNVFLAQPSSDIRDPVCTIADTAIGGLTWWSQGNMYDGAASKFRPPEWQAKAHAPSPKADLYAVGVLACEMLLGKEGVEGIQSVQSEHNAARSPWSVVQPRLKRHGAPIELRSMIGRLLADETHRPSGAMEARDEFRRLRRWASWRLWRWAAAIVALVLAPLLVWGFAMAQGKVTAAEQQADKFRDEAQQSRKEYAAVAKLLEGKESELQHVRTELQAQIVSLEALLQRPNPAPPGPRPDPKVTMQAKAQVIWSDLLPTDESVLLDLRSFQDADAKLRRGDIAGNGSPQDRTMIAKDIRNWHGRIYDLRNKSRDWLGYDGDDDLQQLYKRATKAPWDADIVAAASDRCNALDTAAKEWNSFAEGDRPLGDLELIIKGVKSQAAQDVLNRWRSEIVKKDKWTIRFVKGTAPPGYGVLRRISVKGTAWTEGPFHDWKLDGLHDYRTQSTNSDREINIAWNKDEPLVIAMEGERSWKSGYRPYRLFETISGPLAIWLAHKLGRVSNADGFSLEFEIVDCPGPPRAKFRAVPSPAQIPIAP